MPILGHGIDIIETRRIEEILERHGERFLTRVFTPAEAAYACDHRRRIEHLAGRFAAKEAVLKALGTGLSKGIAWTDVEVQLLPSGQPTVRLHGRAAVVALGRAIREWSLSISHARAYAVASAIAVGSEPP